MHYNHSSLSRVERALDRLGLLKRSCAFIRNATGMNVPGVFDTDFQAWIEKLENFPITSVKNNKRHKKSLGKKN